MRKLTVARLGAVAMAVALSGCATIVGHPDQTIPVSSTPSDAQISIVDEGGVEVFKGTTPTTVTLAKSTGHYWGKKSYTVKIATTLGDKTAHNNTSKDGSIVVMLLQDVPVQLRGQLTRVN